MARIKLIVNQMEREVDVDPDMKLLWVIRDVLGLTGTKYGCGMSLCGSCTVHIDGKAVRSCSKKVGSVEGKQITTIEGLAIDTLHPLQQAWDTVDVPQCGYCQPGQIMTAAALLNSNPQPSDADIDKALARNLCRCGTYLRIRKAIHRVVELGGMR